MYNNYIGYHTRKSWFLFLFLLLFTKICLVRHTGLILLTILDTMKLSIIGKFRGLQVGKTNA